MDVLKQVLPFGYYDFSGTALRVEPVPEATAPAERATDGTVAIRFARAKAESW